MTRYAKNGGVAPGYAYGRIVTLTQQWLYLTLTKNSFYFLFPTGCERYRELSLLYIRLK